MESNQYPFKKLKSIEENKLSSANNYNYFVKEDRSSRIPRLVDIEILPKNNSFRQSSQKVRVSIEPRFVPAIKTLFIAEKFRYFTKKGSDRLRSRLGLGDHSTFATRSSVISSVTGKNSEYKEKIEATSSKNSSALISEQVESSTTISQFSQSDTAFKIFQNVGLKSDEKTYIYTVPEINMNVFKSRAETETSKPSKSGKLDIATLTDVVPYSETIYKLNKRVDLLERKIFRQEIVFRLMDSNLTLSSSDEETKDNMKSSSGIEPGCSYIEYSHVPETSAFQRYAQKASHLSSSRATTLDKEHNSEQYGRDFTTYDGITARGRRQCASVPCKRDDIPKMAAERVHKIRHKLNPVRDYRLMDTVHYLAQGEFAPRDDGIKLTPSREAVLSDIIWEDVCRAHWPNARLGRRVTHAGRYSTRYELQRLIDNLLKERVAHVERRRRRHYRIVKLNNRHENCRPVGKTGDIIVASHKNREGIEGNITISDHNATSEMMPNRQWEKQSTRNVPRSHDRFTFPHRRHRLDESIAGPSYSIPKSPNRESSCYYHTSEIKDNGGISNNTGGAHSNVKESVTSCSSMATGKAKNPRLVLKKETSRRKNYSKEGPDLKHFILLPTLVVRTPSNVKRQNKFNELYHRLLNVQLNNNPNPIDRTVNQEAKSTTNRDKLT